MGGVPSSLAPVAGGFIGANQDAADAPESVNGNPYAAWLFKIEPNKAGDISAFLGADGYAKLISED